MSDARLPEAFVERLGEELDPEDLPGVLAAFAAPRPLALRLNPLRGEPEAVLAELRTAGLAPVPAPEVPDAWLLPRVALRRLQETAAAERGALLVQGLASQLVAPILAPRPGERVLDLCAAPGGKAAHLAVWMEDRGELVANEKSRRRAFKLRALLEAQGVRCARVVVGPGERFGRLAPASFDRVLVDAPCSGEGRFRLDDPESLADWKPAKVKRLAVEQERLLLAGLRALRPGGRLVYSTCTLSVRENERVVARALARFEGAARVVPLAAPLREARPGRTRWRGRPLSEDLRGTVRVLPGPRTEGFFLALLERSAAGADGRGEQEEAARREQTGDRCVEEA